MGSSEPSRALYVKLCVAIFLLAALEGSFVSGSLAYFIRSTGSIAAANLAVSAFWFAMCATDIPSGIWTDHYGPRAALLVGTAMRCVAFGVFFLFMGSFAAAAIGNAIAGAAVAFNTGVFTAYLRLVQSADGFAVDYTRFSAYSFGSRAGGLAIGGIGCFFAMSHFGLQYIWIGAIILSCGLLLYVALFWTPVRSNHETRAVNRALQCVGLLFTSAPLRLVLFLNAVLVVTSLSIADNWAAVFVPQLERSPGWLAILAFFVAMLRSCVGFAYSAMPVLHRISPLYAGVAFGAALVASALTSGPLSFVCFSAALAFLTVGGIGAAAQFTAHVKPENAATLSSLQNTIVNGIGAGGYVLLAHFLQTQSIRASWAVSGISAITACLFFVAPGRARSLLNRFLRRTTEVVT